MQEETIGTLIIGMKKTIVDEEIRLLLTMCNLVAGVIYRANLMDQVRNTYRATIQGWAHALEIREQEKKGHSVKRSEPDRSTLPENWDLMKMMLKKS